MKKIRLALAVVLLLAGVGVRAGVVTEQEALRKAQQFMQGKQLKHRTMRRAPQKDGTDGSSRGYYVFNVEDNGGFVIVAGDDRMTDILGYAEKGSIDMRNLPDNMKWLLDYYAKVATETSTETSTSTRTATVDRPELQPLITTHWDQGAPYNAHCPMASSSVQALTGCVATSMAQVINYFQWPISEARSVAEYQTKTFGQTVSGLPPRKFQWFSMSDDEIAWLMRYCGQAVQMDYMEGESVAQSIEILNALVSVFDYSRTVQFVDRSSYSDADWEELMYSELSVGRPVIYSGDHGLGTVGHSFILHGYKDGLFYVNWGWSGNCDGYFALTNLCPNENQAFTENQMAIIAIQPSSNNDDESIDAALERTIHLDKAGTLSSFISEEEKLNIKKLTLTGNVNKKDFELIREMAQKFWYEEVGGRLETLDLSGANIVGNENTQNHVISDGLFFDCNILQTIILPGNITAIENCGFRNSGLRSISIPKSVTWIGKGIFEGCNNLSQIEMEEGNANYYAPEGCNVIIERANQKVIAGCPNSIIPEGVVTIGSSAFSTRILSVNLPESLETIENQAFSGASLVSLHIPKNVKKIGNGAFYISNLKSITVDPENTVYDSRNNSNCLIETATNTVVLGCDASRIPEGVEAIGEKAFSDLYMTSFDLPQSLKQIGDFAFRGNRFNRLEIPAGVTSIGFNGVLGSYLKVLRVKAQTPPSIYEDEFMSKNDFMLVVPNGTKALYQAAKGWKAIPNIIEESESNLRRTVNIATAGTLSTLLTEKEAEEIEELVVTGEMNEDDFKFIRQYMSSEDRQKSMLRVLDLSEARVMSRGQYDILGERVLAGTASIEEVILPNTLKDMGWSPFWGSGIKKIVIPKTVTDAGRDIFYQCDQLASIVVEEGNEVYDSRENCNAIIETATNTLVQGCRTTVVPKSVEALGATSFSGVNGLTTIDLPDGVKSIGENAFWSDISLTKITLSKSVINLGDGPFVGCSNVSSCVIDPENPVYDSRNNCNAIIETATNTLVQGFGTTVIPEEVVKIAPLAFMYQDMNYIEIPANVKEIGPAAFRYANNLTTVVSRIKKPFPLGTNVFDGSNMETATLYVPFGTKKAYSTTAGWGSFPKIVEMEPTDEEYGRHSATVETVDFGKQYAGLNGETLVPVYIVGESFDPITSIDYTITTGGKEYKGHMELDDPITYMMTAQVLIPFEADASVGEQTKTLTITQVNGLVNESTDNTATGTLVTVKRKPKHVALVEEATGTWCGWCPRGAVGLKMLNEKYADEVITVAVHSGDPMVLTEYYLRNSGFPSCQINRGTFIDPYYGSSSAPFSIKYDIEAAQREYTIGEIALDAKWKDANKTAIDVTATATFVEDVEQSPYQIGFILLDNGQTGTTSEWAQSNYYSGAANNDANLKQLLNKPAKIKDMKYDYVPVAVWEHESGIAGSLPATITSEKPMDFKYTLDIADNDRIQNKDLLIVVALLLNKDTYEVVNAAKFMFCDPETLAVTEIGHLGTFDVYNTQGYLVRKGTATLNGLPAGVYVVRSDSGNGKKIVVR